MSEKADHPTPPADRRSPSFWWLPPLRVWFIVGLFAGGIAWARSPYGPGDHALINILTFVFGALSVMTLAFWFVCFSHGSRSTRFGYFALAILGITVFFTLFEIHEFSGEMVPSFRWRFATPPDQVLEVPVATTSEADLSVTSTEDFPHFLGAARDARQDAVSLDTDWENNPPKVLWRQPIGAGWSGFAAVNGFAVTMEQRGPQELVTCYRIADGELIWTQSTETRHETKLGGIGPRSTPAIAKGRVYTLGATGHVHCLDGRDGSVLWSDNLLERFGVAESSDAQGVAWGRAGSPLIVDDLVVFPAGGPAGGPFRSLIAYSQEDGKVVWEAGDRQVSYSSPNLLELAGTRQIVSVNEDNVSGHRVETGETLWQHEWPGTSTADANNSQAVGLPQDTVFVSKGYGAGAMTLKISNDGNEVFLSEEIWRQPRVLKTKMTNVVVHDGYVYGLSDGILECASIETGRKQWKRGRYGHGQILAVQDQLLVLTETGEIVLGKLDPKSWRETSKLPVLEGKTWNTVCLAGRFLLVRNAEEATCLELPLASSELASDSPDESAEPETAGDSEVSESQDSE